MRVEVVVRTRKVGHFFPGGTVDAFDVWVEFEAVDDRGRVLLHSGAAADGGSGPVDPGAHFYRSLQLDAHGNPINKRNAWMTRSVAYVRLIPPGAADTVHYRLRVPEDAGDRKSSCGRRSTTGSSPGGIRSGRSPGCATTRRRRRPPTTTMPNGGSPATRATSRVGIKAIPDIPTTVMAEAEATLEVIDAESPLPEVPRVAAPSLRERWNDYGIGLLLQGDLRGAEAAFRMVMEIEPGVRGRAGQRGARAAAGG